MNEIEVSAALLFGPGSRKEKVRTLKQHGPQALLDLVAPPSLFGGEGLPLHQVHNLHNCGCAIVTPISSDYPRMLALSDDDPGLLFVTGTLLRNEPTVAIVGSRSARPRELAFAGDLARKLGRMGICVASGLATGIDTAAHRGALQAGGRTIAVMGTGPDLTYPNQNLRLRQRIEQGGACITQFPPGQEGTAFTFPRRNITMAALSTATVIVAAEESSGTRHQALATLRNGRTLIITPQVAEREWAKPLSGKPGVHIASTITHVISAITSALHRAD